MKFVLTDDGRDLQAKVEAGETPLNISKITASEEMPEHPEQLHGLPGERQCLQIDSIKADGDRAVITAALSNMTVEEGYILHSIGVYARDTDGSDVLFLAAADPVGDEVKPGTEEEFIIEYNIALKISNAEQVIFDRNLDDYVRKRQFYEHVEDYDNPHRTTKAQVGLSEVPNVSTNNQTPTWEPAKERSLPKSGDQLSVIMGKIETYLAGLQSDLVTYCPFIIMYQDIPVFDRVEDKMYLMVTDKRGITYNYADAYIFMDEDVPEGSRKELTIYGKETSARSGLELEDRLAILRMLTYTVLSSRDLAEGGPRSEDTFYFFETEERTICQEL